MKRRVLFLCTGNSARSQMAEAVVNHLRGERWQAFSAGTHPAGYVHPHAITALNEIGIDISAARSKSAEEFRDAAFDLVVTVCDDAAEECPVWLGAGKRGHVGFPDPAQGSLGDFRAGRDDISEKIIALLDAQNAE
ncbi:MAG: arsenate reductase ArsC [Chloroflexi bacterium]|nr:arsenate reductase ArsC [Chloroflexota bacterium]